MNVLEQLQALGFEEKPLQFYDGGDAGDPSGGTGDGGQGPGGTDVGAEISVDYGGTGPSVGDTVGQGSVTGPSGPYGGPNSVDNAQVAAAMAPAVALATELATSPGQAVSLAVQALNDLGFGAVTGFNANNPTQSIAEMQAAQNVAQYGVPLALSVIPGAGLAQSLGRGLGSLAAGKTSLADLATDLGLQALAGKIGVPGGVLTGLAKGDVGGALQSAGMGLAQSAFSQATGLPGGLFGTGLSLAMGSGAFGGQGGTSAGAGDAGSGGLNFSGVGGAETYSPTEQLQQSFNPMSVAGGYGVNVNDALANVTPGLQKAPYGSMPYSMEV